jgi:hypothetical protein
METSMHGQFEKPGRSDRRVSRDTGVGFLILPIVIVIVLVVLAVIQPTGSNWIAEAVQAEFIGDTLALPDQSPRQLAQPATEPHSGAADWIARIQTAYRGQR